LFGEKMDIQLGAGKGYISHLGKIVKNSLAAGWNPKSQCSRDVYVSYTVAFRV